MNTRHAVPCWFLLILAALQVAAFGQSTQPPATRHMMAQAYYFREPTDRAWSVKITGKVPSLPGAYLLLCSAAGKLVYKGHLPYGEYSAQKPFDVNVPADGITGDYKLSILGSQNDFLGIDLPLSDLPFEVYGGKWLSFAADKTPMPFKVRAGTTVLGMRAYRGYLKVLDEQNHVVADARAGVGLMVPGDANKDFYNKLDSPIEFPVDPQKYYWLVADTMYFEPRTPVFFATDPQRLFEPDPKLETINWWDLI